MLDQPFQNRVLDAFIAAVLELSKEGTQFWPSRESVDIIYKATPKNSPARKMMVAMHVYAGLPHWIDNDPDASNEEFSGRSDESIIETTPSSVHWSTDEPL